MTFISKKLLLDLPLNAQKEGQWRDESGHDRHAKPHPLCKEDTLPKLGACLHLKDGGH
ncbi:MAG: hypothetical protein OEV38_13050 [Nitrospira sp.]|nr:hypothetical protein [Nitrospira sp.]MDH4357228.1 hypothetical protein [Nitrospira sp.]MDH5320365.1 hypothetical protein [Nitrospira sp.]